MRILDNIIALRIIYLLTMPFEKTEAFKLGLIDKDGRALKPAKTSQEKNASSMLHHMVWNVKRIFALAPGGSSRIASLAAAYLLIKESYEQKMDLDQATTHFNENIDRVWGLPYEEKELVEDALVFLLSEDAPANAVGDGSAVSTNTSAIKRARKFAEFSVDHDTFGKFKNGKAKFRKWATYLNLEDESHKKIYDFATKNHRGIIVLKSPDGVLKGIRYSRRGSGNWANISRKPKEIVESIMYSELDVEEMIL